VAGNGGGVKYFTSTTEAVLWADWANNSHYKPDGMRAARIYQWLIHDRETWPVHSLAFYPLRTEVGDYAVEV